MTANLVSGAATFSISNVTTLPLNMPAGLTAGRLLLAHVYAGATPSLPGWTPIYTYTSTWTLTGYAKIATGSDTGTGSWASAPGGALVQQYDGWSGIIADLVTAVSSDAPLCNPGVAKDWRWIAVQGVILSGSGVLTGQPANYGNFAVSVTGGATSGNIGTSDRALNASSEDPGAYTASGGVVFLAGATVAIPPAAPSVGNPSGFLAYA